ncbi:unnamed protein product [Auanema sp. JU1783]|nr:unnamed protein product [Auanema sp. JU1783]
MDRIAFSLSIILLISIISCYKDYDDLPGGVEGVTPQFRLRSDRMKLAFGNANEYYGQRNYLEIPAGPGSSEKLAVPKAFYHYSEHDTGAEAKFGLPDNYMLLASNTAVRNNRRDINGMYLPLPNMDPINLHFITERKFEKGLDTSAYEDSAGGALAKAKKTCLSGDELMCEKALLHYYRVKSSNVRTEKGSLSEQLLSLGDLSSNTKVRDREGTGMGVVVGVPGYDPLYVGAALDNNNDGDVNIRFSPPK